MLGPEQKLYQLIISRLEGNELSSLSYKERAVELVRKGIGGFIVFGGKRDKLRSFIAELQSISEAPLFVASDIERGVGQQIGGASLFPCQMAVAAAISKNKPDDGKILEDAIKAIANEAQDIGINMPLIPVLDVNTNPDNPIICTRSFSDNREDVAWFGNMYIQTLENAGLISCAKHFPGHGDTAVDSHISLPLISKSFSELTDTDIFPFREAIKAGVGSIMIGHLSVPAIDIFPASLSKKAITDLLRAELGHEGLILTDALNMHALNEFNDVPAKCINAGVDILLHPADADSVVEELKYAVTSGKVEERKIDTAVERILKFKSRLKNIQKSEVNYEEHAELSAMMSDKSITLVKDSPGLLPIRNVQSISLVTAGDNPFVFSVGSGSPRPFKCEELKGDIPDIQHKTLALAIYTNIAAWEGSSGIRDEDINVIRKLISKSRNSIVISFGSPYVLRHFMEADILIAAYDTTQQAQASVIKCLKGDKGFIGKLPVKF
jgi:beta-glucosidase-like glycosyl hydrolase